MRYIKPFLLLVCVGLFLSYSVNAAKPLAFSVTTAQDLDFGTFYQGSSGGTVTVSHNGVRTVTGDIIELDFGSPYLPAIFEVKADLGSNVSILNGADILLSGSNGGSILLQIGSSNPASPFNTVVSPPTKTEVYVGATLTIGSPQENPPGAYSGFFSVTFNLE